MRLESRSLNKGTMMAGNNRKRSYGLLLLLALGAALLSIVVLHKLRERRVLGLLLRDRERELLAFQLLLQKERGKTKEMKSRLDDLRDKTISFRHQKTELYNKLMETETTVIDLKRMQKEMEATLQKKENEINQITEKAAESVEANQQVSALTELLKQKDAEIEELKHRISEVHQRENITPAPENDIVNNVTALDHTKENENLRDRSLASTNPSDRKTSEGETQFGSAHETASSSNSEKGTWVKLETIIEDERLKDESESDDKQSAEEVSQDNRLEKIEVSQGSEHSGKQEETDQESPVEAEEHIERLKDEDLVVGTGDHKPERMESTSREMEGKEQWDTEDDNSKKLENSQFRHEQKASTDLTVDSTIEHPKMKHRRRKRTKTKSRRRPIVPRGMELEKHAWEHNKSSQEDGNQVIRTETVDSSTVDADKEALTGSDQTKILDISQLTEDLTTDAGSSYSADKEQTIIRNDENLKMTTSLHKNEASKTMEIKENTKEDDTKGSPHIADDKKPEHEAEGSFSSTSKLDIPESFSDDNAQNPESGGDIKELKGENSTGGEHEGEEKEVISTDEKLEESDTPQNDDLVKPNYSDLQIHQQEVTVSAT